ncbi:MAG TPA: hypothetical protein VMT91_03490 [Anaerolineales bacterium]|nr:hypothetical protein [Anaerolineales bacterium]
MLLRPGWLVEPAILPSRPLCKTYQVFEEANARLTGVAANALAILFVVTGSDGIFVLERKW